MQAALIGLFALACVHDVPPQAAAEHLQWPPPPEDARLEWVGTIESSDDAEPPGSVQEFVWSMVGRSVPPVRFKKPFGVTTDDQGRVYVSDTGWGAVLVFDRTGGDFAWRGKGGRGQLIRPLGLEVDEHGNLYVADAELERVHKYSPDGDFLAAFGAGVLVRPSDIAILEDRQEIWVVDSKMHGIAVFDYGGQHLRTIGQNGSGLGAFSHPTHIATRPDGGEVFVSDTMNFRIQVLDREGNAVRTWGENGDCLRCFSRAKGIAVSPDNHVYVADAAFNNVRIFQPDGSLLLFFGEGGDAPGQLWLPAGVHYDQQDQVLVVSQYTWRVNTYQFLRDHTAAE